MLLDVLAWTVLLAVAYCIGRGAVALLGVSRMREGDHVVLASWLGLMVLAVALLGASVVLPLTPGASALVAGVLALGGWLAGRHTSGDIEPRTPRLISRRAVTAGVALVTVGAAMLASDAVTLYDSLVYHVGIVRWLRALGTVPGVALLHNRLGHVSSWFALAAPFDPGRGAATGATVPLGVALILVAGQGALGTARILARRAAPADWFLIVGSAALMWPVLAVNAATPSPDVAANVLIVLSTWAMFAVSTSGASVDPPRPARRMPNAWRSPRAVPFAIALCACTVKLFALPAAVGTALYYVLEADDAGVRRVAWRRVAACIAIAAVIAGPFFVANAIASGCLLFPSPVSCINTRWSLRPGSVADYATYIREVARWETRGYGHAVGPLVWLRPWIGAHPLFTTLLAAAPVLAALILRRARSDAVAGALAVSFMGLAFSAWQAPAPRFLFAYLIIPPAVTVACLLGGRDLRGTVESAPPPSASARKRADIAFVAFGAISMVIYALPSQQLNVVSTLHRRPVPVHRSLGWLLAPIPPEVPARLYRWRINDVDVLTPVPRPIVDTLGYHSTIDPDVGFEKCSTAPLPCTPYLPPDVRLRNPRRGLAGGFARGADDAPPAPRCVGELIAPFSRTSIQPATPPAGSTRCGPGPAGE